MLRSSLFVLIVFIPAAASASSADAVPGAGSIRQLQLARHRAIITFKKPDETKVGDEWPVTLPSGNLCSVKVIATRGSNALVDTSICANESELAISQIAEKPTLAAPSEVQESISDLGYRVPKRKLSVTGTFTASELKTSSMASFTTSAQKSNYFDEAAKPFLIDTRTEYGISDTFSMAILLRYLTGASDEITYGSASTLNGSWTKTSSHGVTDPGIGLSCRVPLRSSTLKLDFALNYSPKLVEAKLATKAADGTAGRGGNQIQFEAQISQKIARYEWALRGAYSSFGLATRDFADGSGSVSTSGEQYFGVATLGQMQIGSTTHLHLGVDYKKYGEQNATTDTGSTTHTNPYSQISAEAGVLMDIRRFAFGILYSNSFPVEVSGKVGAFDSSLTLSSRTLSVVGRTEF